MSEGHGTYAAYLRHHREGSVACDACSAANREYMQGRRQANPAINDRSKRQMKLRARALTRLQERHPDEYEEIYRQVVAEDRVRGGAA